MVKLTRPQARQDSRGGRRGWLEGRKARGKEGEWEERMKGRREGKGGGDG